MKRLSRRAIDVERGQLVVLVERQYLHHRADFDQRGGCVATGDVAVTVPFPRQALRRERSTTYSALVIVACSSGLGHHDVPPRPLPRHACQWLPR